MKDCWLYNNKSEQFRTLMKDAILNAYDNFCLEV